MWLYHASCVRFKINLGVRKRQGCQPLGVILRGKSMIARRIAVADDLNTFVNLL
jgi:hypothetical protein